VPVSAFLKLKGQQQGDIKGGSTQRGRTGQIQVVGWSHEVQAPRDVVSGIALGKRVHKPLVITKEIDRASPALYTAWATNESLTGWQLFLWRPGPSGVEQQYFTIQLSHATVSGIQVVQPDARDPAFEWQLNTEMVSFTYQSITWTWTDGNLAATDSWLAGV
jgi:type VI secretion system secreted protein Hcp